MKQEENNKLKSWENPQAGQAHRASWPAAGREGKKGEGFICWLLPVSGLISQTLPFGDWPPLNLKFNYLVAAVRCKVPAEWEKAEMMLSGPQPHGQVDCRAVACPWLWMSGVWEAGAGRRTRRCAQRTNTHATLTVTTYVCAVCLFATFILCFIFLASFFFFFFLAFSWTQKYSVSPKYSPLPSFVPLGNKLFIFVVAIFVIFTYFVTNM